MLKYIVLFAVCVVETFVMGGVPLPHFNWYAGIYKENHATSTSSSVPEMPGSNSGVYVNDWYCDIDILKGVDKIHQMVYNRHQRTVYFTFEKTDRFPKRVLGYYEDHTGKTALIEGIRNPLCIAVDDAYNYVYVGGPDGIYILNWLRVPERLSVQDDIQSMYFKDVLYYTNSRKQAFIYSGGIIKPVFELQGMIVDNIVLVDDDCLFMMINKHLLRVQLRTRQVFFFVSYSPQMFSTGFDRNLYMTSYNVVYKYVKKSQWYIVDQITHEKTYEYIFEKVQFKNGVFSFGEKQIANVRFLY